MCNAPCRPADLRIVRFIGSGGFADCYLAKWLGVEVAVKSSRDMPDCAACSKVCKCMHGLNQEQRKGDGN